MIHLQNQILQKNHKSQINQPTTQSFLKKLNSSFLLNKKFTTLAKKL